MPIITIQMRGGVVQNVEGIPPAVTIRIQSEGEVKEFTAPPSTLPLLIKAMISRQTLKGKRLGAPWSLLFRSEEGGNFCLLHPALEELNRIETPIWFRGSRSKRIHR